RHDLLINWTMDARKNEKSLDNRCAALGSRILGSRDWRLGTRPTRWHRSDAREALQKCGPNLSVSRRDVTPCDTDVPECHKCDIARFIHKLICRNGLDFKLQPNGPHFREMCDILRHFVTWRARDQKLETGNWTERKSRAGAAVLQARRFRRCNVGAKC